MEFTNFPLLTDSPIRDYVNDPYIRPNFDDFLSPLSSANFSSEVYLKEKKARKRLRELLEEQADINETLADENEILVVQQKSLLKLLITKDKQLQKIAAYGCSMNTTTSCTQEAINYPSVFSGLEKVERFFTGRLRTCFRRIEKTKWESICKRTQTTWSLKVMCGVFKDLEFRVLKKAFCNFKNNLKSDFNLPKLIGRIFKSRVQAGFNKLGLYHLSMKLDSSRNRNLASKLPFLMLAYVQRVWELRVNLTKWKSQSKARKSGRILSRVLSEKFLKFQGAGFLQIKNFLIDKNRKKLKEDHTKELMRLSAFSKKFICVNAVVCACKKLDTIQVQKYFWKWKGNNKQLGVFILSKVLSNYFARGVKLFFHNQPTSTLLPYLLRQKSLDVLKFCFFKLQNSAPQEAPQEMNELEGQLIKISEQKKGLETYVYSIEKEKGDLTQLLNKKEQECKQLSEKISKHLDQLEVYQTKTQEEKDSLTSENTSLKSKLEYSATQIESLDQEVNSLQSKISQLEDEKRMADLKISKLESSFKKVQESYAHVMNEKSKVQANELEHKKQLISLTNTIDSLAEDKDNLIEKLTQASNDLSDLRDQLTFQQQQNKKLSSELEYYFEREKQLQQTIQELEENLEEESELQRSNLFQKDNEIKQLKEQNQSYKEQVDQLKKELEKKTQNSDKERVKKLMRENAQLSAKLEEFQKQAFQGKSTSSQLSSQVLKLNKEIADLKIEVKNSKHYISQTQHENSNLKQELENAQHSIKKIQTERDRLLDSLQTVKEQGESKAQTKINNLRDYCTQLENQITYLKSEVSKKNNQYNETETLKLEKKELENRLSELQEEVEACRDEAFKSREEVAKVCTEIENYANILEAMEEKILETEERAKKAEQAREQAESEIKAVRQRYINYIAESG